MSALAALAALLAAAPDFDPMRRVDLQLSAFTATPERFVLCVGVHPGRAVELDLCGGVDRGLYAGSAHGHYRWRWLWSHGGARGLSLALGPGLGARVMAFCPFGACAAAAGPELLASLEAVEWLLAGFGLTAQLDGGVAVLWTQAAPGVAETMLRFPLRLSLGVAF